MKTMLVFLLLSLSSFIMSPDLCKESSLIYTNPSSITSNNLFNYDDIEFIRTNPQIIKFSSNGYVNSVEVFAYDTEGDCINLDTDVIYHSMNEQVATVNEGNIRATGKGKTFILVEYKELFTYLEVVVENEIDLDVLEESLLSKAGTSINKNYENILRDTYDLTSRRTSQEILDKAAAMKNIRWTPTKVLTGWNKNIIFDAGVAQTGIPYSQNSQVDDIKFTQVLGNSDFYNNVTIDGYTCPRYGVDCAKYVCYSLNISARYTGALVADIKSGSATDIMIVGSYNPNKLVESQLNASYEQLNPGNAAVYHDGSKGHAILVLSNSPSTKEIVVYETANTKPIVSIYPYSTMWNKRYLPFKLK